jgi:glycosyltransferase involved in cell wall biosynthesis
VCTAGFGRVASADCLSTFEPNWPRVGNVVDMLARAASISCGRGGPIQWTSFFLGQGSLLGSPAGRQTLYIDVAWGNLPKFAARREELVRSLLASAVAVTTPSTYLMEHMRPYRNDIQVLPNGISIGNYPYKLRRPGDCRLIWLRAFHEVYNPEMAVQALALLTQDFPEIHLTMIGPDKGDGSLERTRQEAERLGVTDHLTLLGAVRKEDIPGKLADGDIFVNTARIDNTPVSVLEAMASGLCVVSTCVGGIPYLVQAEREALLVPADDAKGMAEAVRRIIIEPDLSKRLSCNARRKAEQLDWSIILPCWDKLLRSAIHPDS